MGPPEALDKKNARPACGCERCVTIVFFLPLLWCDGCVNSGGGFVVYPVLSPFERQSQNGFLRRKIKKGDGNSSSASISWVN